MEKHILQEAFKALDVLEEDAFNLSDTGSMDDFSNFIKDDDDKEEISIIDPDTDSEEGLEDNYVGKVILDCSVCHSKLYFDPQEVVIDEDEELVNVGTECPYCYSVDGYKIIGEVAPYEKTDESDEDESDGDEDEDVETEEEKEEVDEGIEDSLTEPLKKAADSFGKFSSTINDKLGESLKKPIRKSSAKKLNEDEETDKYDRFYDDVYSAVYKLAKKYGISDKRDIQQLFSYYSSECGQYDWPSMNESFIKKLNAVLRRLNEAEMSDEDKADTEILKRIYDKTQRRSNAKLTPEEKAILDKYGLKRWSDKDITKKERAEDHTFPLLNTDRITRAMDRGKPVNLADKARKMGTRGSGYRPDGAFYYDTPYDPTRGRPLAPDKKYKWTSWRSPKRKGLLDMERQAENSDMYEPVRSMKHALADKKSASASLANMDREFQAKKDAAKAKYDKEIADLEKSKKWNTEWDTDKLSRAQGTIDTLLKRDKDRPADTEVDESLKESVYVQKLIKKNYEEDPRGIPLVYSGSGGRSLVGIDYDSIDKFSSKEEAEENLRKYAKNPKEWKVVEYSEESKVDESLKESFEKVDIETENERMSMTADETGKVSVTTEPKSETIVPVTSDTKDEIAVANTDDNMRDVIDVDVDEFDEESFDELGESYFKKNYSNVSSYKTTKITESNDRLVVEGLIKFNSGKEKATTFIFESKDATKSGKIRFIGENQQITRGHKSFTLSGSLNNKKFIAESFNYNYRAKDDSGKSVRLYGTVRKNKINEADEHPDLTGKENSISTILMKNKSKIDSAKSKDELIKVLTDALGQKGGQKAQEVLRIAKSKKDLTAALTYVYNFILKGEHKGTIGSKKRYK